MFSIVKVHANKYNKTGIDVTAGQKLTIECDLSDKWKDLWIECNYDGWNSHVAMFPFVKKCKDLPDENLMKMCAQIGTKLYAIGKEATITVEEDGELVLFANDIKYLRWNNSGSIDVTIRTK